MIDYWEGAAVLRRCGRCCEWLPLREYEGLAKLCRECVPCKAKLIGRQRCRNIVITGSGRELLRQIRAEEDNAA